MARRSSKPPPLPAEVFLRVVRLGTVHGRMVLIVAAISAVLSTQGENLFVTAIATLAAGAGAMEMHGAGQLQRQDSGGIGWLVGAELFLLGLILAYCAYQFPRFDIALYDANLPQSVWDEYARLGYSREDMLPLLRITHQLTYVVLGAVATVYQGAMARYYAKRKPVVEQVLASD